MGILGNPVGVMAGVWEVGRGSGRWEDGTGGEGEAEGGGGRGASGGEQPSVTCDHPPLPKLSSRSGGELGHGAGSSCWLRDRQACGGAASSSYARFLALFKCATCFTFATILCHRNISCFRPPARPSFYPHPCLFHPLGNKLTVFIPSFAFSIRLD